MSERWNEGAVFRFTGNERSGLQSLSHVSPVRVKHATTGAAGDLVTIVHRLGRIPQGMRIVNSILPSAPSLTPGWYRIDGDPDWTINEISVRFRCDTAAQLLLEVF